MRNPVMIKGNKYGLTLFLDPQTDFSELLPLVGERFSKSGRFFSGESQIAIRFEGRELTIAQQSQIIDQIEENSDIRISYVMDQDERNEACFKEAVEEYGRKLREAFIKEKEEYKEELLEEAKKQPGSLSRDGQFYRGTLRSGQSMEVPHSIVVVGDVNPGADVIAGGNIVVLGCLKGSVSAGFPGDQNAFVVALDMQPMQIRIGDMIARSPDNAAKGKPKKKKKENRDPEAKIAYAADGNIYIEPVSRSLMNEINAL